MSDMGLESKLRQTLRALAEDADTSAEGAASAIRARLTAPVPRRGGRWLIVTATSLAVGLIAGLPVAFTHGLRAGQQHNTPGQAPGANRFAAAPITTVAVPIGITRLAVTPDAIWAVGEAPNSTEATPGRLVRVDPTTGAVVANIAVGVQPMGVAVTATDVWVANSTSNTVSRIDISRAVVVATVHTPGAPNAVVVSPEGVWIVSGNADSGALTRVDSSSGQTVAAIQVPAMPMAIAYVDGALWVASEKGDGALTKIDPATNQVEQSEQLPQVPDPFRIAASGNTLAVIGENGNALDLVDGTTGRVKRSVPLPFPSAAVTADTNGVYVASSTGGRVIQFPVSASGSLGTSSPISRTLTFPPVDATTGLGAAWFAGSGGLVRIPTS